MRLQIYSWDGHVLNSTDTACWIATGALSQGGAQAVSVERANRAPVLAGKRIELRTMPLTVEILGERWSVGQTLKSWFDTHDTRIKRLVAKDADDSDRQWYVEGTPLTYVERYGGVTVILALADPVWRTVDEVSTTWEIDASGDELALSVEGNVLARPVLEITPTGPAGGGYGYQEWVAVYNPTDRPYDNHPIDLTDGGWDTATLVLAGQMQADGDDLRVQVNGVEASRWLADVDTDHTKLWTVLSLKPRVELTLGAAIADSGTVGEIQLQPTKANTAMLARLATFPAVMLFGDEAFVVTGKDAKTMKLAVSQRAAKNTSMAAHLVGELGRWIEHDVWIVYGNAGVSAPETDDTRKPVIDLSQSTNTTWVYDGAFVDADGLRSGSWRPALLGSTGKLSQTYGGTNGGDDAEPYEVMGMLAQAWQKAGRWQREGANLEWRLHHPAGFTEISASGEKKRTTANWINVLIQRGATPTRWTTVVTETTPVSQGSWTAWSRTGQAITFGPLYLRFWMNGSLSALADNQVHFEVGAVTVKMTAASCPKIVRGTTTANFWLEATITHEESGRAITVQCPMVIGKTLMLDSDQKIATYEGVGALGALRLSSVRDEWLPLHPGVNTLIYTAENVGTVQVVVKYRERNN